MLYAVLEILILHFFLQFHISKIIDNAIKYSPVNGDITISVKPEKGYVYINFSDDGPGFSEDAKKNIFINCDRGAVWYRDTVCSRQCYGTGGM